MNICHKCLFIVAIITLSISNNAKSQQLDEEWVVVLDDPRPARLRGWQRGNYSGGGHYSQALELKRTGQGIARKHGLAVHAEWFIESLGVYCLIAKFNDDHALTLDRLRSNKNVKWVQPSNNFELLQTTEPGAIDLALLNPPELQLPQSIDGTGVMVAMVDSAVDQTHSDIVERITENIDFVDDTNKASNGEAHGTAIAGLIVADQKSKFGVTGVASGAELKAYRGCWENDSNDSMSGSGQNCNTLTLARALDAVATKSGADILNLSLTGPKDELLDQLVSRIVSQGTTVVIAYDPGRSATDRFPSTSLGVVMVKAGSLDQGHTATFSAPGKKIVAAPGNRANFMQGHSIATAYTSGMLALCAQIEKKMNREICTPSLFARLKSDKTNNLHQLASELERELNSSPPR